jgi:hypothetical protein
MTALDRFWSKVDKTDDCWNWTAGLFENGYGLFRFDNRLVRAHRFSWELVNGEIPTGMQVNHHCDNKRCVNPAHLYVGDQKQNRADSVNRGRTAKGLRNGTYTHPESRRTGELNGNSKLTNRQMDEIRETYRIGNASLSKLGRQYGVTKQSIWHIVHYVPPVLS